MHRHKDHSKLGHTFLASVYRIWMLRYVDVPQVVVRALLKKPRSGARGPRDLPSNNRYIPVVATVNGRSVRTTLLPAGGGRYRMQFNAELRNAGSADVGDLVGIQIARDPASRERAVPADLRALLREHPKAATAFRKAPPGLRRQMVKWMDSARSEGARRRRIEIIIDRMLERAVLGPGRRSPRKM